MKASALLVSHETRRTPEEQTSAELRLLGAAALGEAHLHVSALAGTPLAIGAFEAPPAHLAWWRRSTGGRSVACGEGLAIATVALPHRSALVADERTSLAPEQVMNRAVRGLLGGLRALGLDPIYPGLDFVTVGRRAIAHLGFLETEAGPTLFQAIVALAREHGGSPATTTLQAALGAAGRAPTPPAAGDLATLLARGYADAFALETFELDPAVTRTLFAGDGPASHPPLATPAVPPAGARIASTSGRLGDVHAWVTVAADRVHDAGLHGAFIAPEGGSTRLAAALRGSPATPADLRLRVRECLASGDLYVLGLGEGELADLLARAVDRSVA